MKSETLSLEVGALCDPISKQLAGMGTPALLETYDRLASAITQLHVQRLITDSEAHGARKRLMRKICTGLELATSKR